MKLFSWDTETHRVQPGLCAPPVVVHAYKSEMLEKLSRTSLEIEQALADDSLRIVGANLAYDFGCLLVANPRLGPAIWRAYKLGRVHDVLIASTLYAISQGRVHDGKIMTRDGQVMRRNKGGPATDSYNLWNATLEWTGRDTAKDNDRFRNSYALLEHLDFKYWPPDALQYPVDDVVSAYDTAMAQLDSGFDWSDLKVQAWAAFCLHLSTMFGWRTDPERVTALRDKLSAEHAQIQRWALDKKLLKVVRKKGEEALSKDMKYIKELVTAAYDGDPPLAEKGGVSTSREALEDSYDDTLKQFSKISKIEKLLTYMPTLEQGTKIPVNITANILLNSGRTSYKGMIQTMPRKGGIRNCFKFRWVGISVDYSAVELCTLAQVCLWAVGESKLAEAINAGRDPHCIMAANLTGRSYDDFYAAYKNGDPECKDTRQAGKAANFGYPGVMGAPKFVIAKRREGSSVCEWLHRDKRCGEVKVKTWRGRTWKGGKLCLRCIEEAHKLREMYLDTWPEIRKYWDWVTKQLRHTDVVKHFVSGRLRGGVEVPSAANTFFQGLAADGAKRAVIKLTEEMYFVKDSPLYGARLGLFAHDETIIDTPNDVHDSGFRQRDIMVGEMQAILPDVKVSAEPAAMRYWLKEAEPKFNAEGRLIPWDS